MSDLHEQMLKAMVRIQGQVSGTPGPEVAEQVAAYYDRKGFMRAVEMLRNSDDPAAMQAGWTDAANWLEEKLNEHE